MTQTGIANRHTKVIQLIARAFGQEFDLPVCKIAHSASDFEAGGHCFGGVPKTHALHLARI